MTLDVAVHNGLRSGRSVLARRPTEFLDVNQILALIRFGDIGHLDLVDTRPIGDLERHRSPVVHASDRRDFAIDMATAVIDGVEVTFGHGDGALGVKSKAPLVACVRELSAAGELAAARA